MEEAFFFEHEGARLFGMLHLPHDGPGVTVPRPRAGFVFCDAFADEAWRTHREMVVFARRLAQDGFAVLRFNYRGCGDSAGDFEDFTIGTWLADIGRAISVLEERAGVETVGLLGLRLGGTLAAAVADPRVRYLVLWAPIIHTAKYLRTLQMWQSTHELAKYGKVVSARGSMTRTLASGGAFDLAGNLLTHRLYTDLLDLNPWVAPKRRPDQTLIVGMAGDTTRAADLEPLKETFQPCEVAIVPEKLFWFDRIYQAPLRLYETTSQWLRSLPPDR